MASLTVRKLSWRIGTIILRMIQTINCFPVTVRNEDLWAMTGFELMNIMMKHHYMKQLENKPLTI